MDVLTMMRVNDSRLTREEKKAKHYARIEFCARNKLDDGLKIFNLKYQGMTDKKVMKELNISPSVYNGIKKEVDKLMVAGLTEIKMEKGPKFLSPDRKPMMFLTHTFKLSMLSEIEAYTLFVQRIDKSKAKILLGGDFTSIVNIEVFTKLYSDLLGVEIELSNKLVKFIPGDTVVFMEYHGPVIRHGATEFPFNSDLKIHYIEIDEVKEDLI